jgi:SAM-dependent methyltransferase
MGEAGSGPDLERIRADFDRIALSSTDRWDHNVQYHRYLLKHLPANCAAGLEIGCGTGAFTRLLAGRCRRVLALDLSPQMIRLARERSTAYPTIDFQVGDALRWDFGSERFDCAATIATLHHLPLQEMLLRLREALRPGGVLLVLDLYRGEGWGDTLRSVAALPMSAGIKMLYNRRIRPSQEARVAWDQHGQHDVYPSVTEVRQLCASLLPGAQVRKHLFWRYSIVWQKRGRSAVIVH